MKVSNHCSFLNIMERDAVRSATIFTQFRWPLTVVLLVPDEIKKEEFVRYVVRGDDTKKMWLSSFHYHVPTTYQSVFGGTGGFQEK